MTIENMLSRIKTLSLLTACGLFSCSLFANELEALTAEEQPQRVPTEELIEGIKSSDGRWFEVEVIIFAQEQNQELRETFEQEVVSLEPRRNWDLITPYLKPDITKLLNLLPDCWQELDPFYTEPNQFKETDTPFVFFNKMQNYQQLISSDWKFSKGLCLLPSESQTAFWKLINPVNHLETSNTESYGFYTNIVTDSIPEQITAGDYDDYHNVYLIAEQNLQLKEEFEKLKNNRKTRPLLHIGWRQPGLSQRRSMPFLIKAGKNYSDEFYYEGSAKPNAEETEITDDVISEEKTAPDPFLIAKQASVVNQFMNKINSGAVVDIKNNKLVMPEVTDLPNQTWELDGTIQVHLNHYLYLNAKLNYRELHTDQVDPNLFMDKTESLLLTSDSIEGSGDSVMISAINEDTNITSDPENDLVTVQNLKVHPFSQQRRTYSGDLHYLDHPKVGVLFQIRKYRH